jgi:FeS assembly SUF system protein
MSEKDLQNNNNQENNENITEKNENKTEKKDCDKDKVREQIIKVLQNVYDPEIPVDIWNLGLIYKLEIDDDFNVAIEMTLTAPGCPVAGDIIRDVYYNIAALPCVNAVDVNLTFDPPWNQDMMSEEAKLQLGFM